jgi:hypothetical protein
VDQDLLETRELEQLEFARARLNQEQRGRLEYQVTRLHEAEAYAIKHEIALAERIHENRDPHHQRADLEEIQKRAYNEAREREFKEALARQQEAARATVLEQQRKAEASRAEASREYVPGSVQWFDAPLARSAAPPDAVPDAQRQQDADARARQQRDAETTRLLVLAAAVHDRQQIGRYDPVKRQHEVLLQQAAPSRNPADGHATARAEDSDWRSMAREILDYKTERTDRMQVNPARQDGRDNNPANTPTPARSRGGRTF